MIDYACRPLSDPSDDDHGGGYGHDDGHGDGHDDDGDNRIPSRNSGNSLLCNSFHNIYMIHNIGTPLADNIDILGDSYNIDIVHCCYWHLQKLEEKA